MYLFLFFGREQFGKITIKIPQGSNSKGKKHFFLKGGPSGTVSNSERLETTQILNQRGLGKANSGICNRMPTMMSRESRSNWSVPAAYKCGPTGGRRNLPGENFGDVNRVNIHSALDNCL